MVSIDPSELNKLGRGNLFASYKMYFPKRVAEYLELQQKDEVTYYQILDPKFRDVIIIKKSQ